MPFLVLVTALSVASGCGKLPEQPYQRITSPSLKPGDPIPLGTGDGKVTISGKIGAHNLGETLVMDIAGLKLAGEVDMRTSDPYEKRQVRYRGPLLEDLMQLWKIDSDATLLVFTTENSTQVEVPILTITKYPLVLALMQDGTELSVNSRGPAMLVWPYDYYTFPRPETDALWCWQIVSIDVR